MGYVLMIPNPNDSEANTEVFCEGPNALAGYLLDTLNDPIHSGRRKFHITTNVTADEFSKREY